MTGKARGKEEGTDAPTFSTVCFLDNGLFHTHAFGSEHSAPGNVGHERVSDLARGPRH